MQSQSLTVEQHSMFWSPMHAMVRLRRRCSHSRPMTLVYPRHCSWVRILPFCKRISSHEWQNTRQSVIVIDSDNEAYNDDVGAVLAEVDDLLPFTGIEACARQILNLNPSPVRSKAVSQHCRYILPSAAIDVHHHRPCTVFPIGHTKSSRHNAHTKLHQSRPPGPG